MTTTHVTSDADTKPDADGSITSESHAWATRQAGEQGCALALPPTTPVQAERMRNVLKHVDLDWLMRRHLM